MNTHTSLAGKIKYILFALLFISMPVSSQQNKHYLKGYLGVGYGQLFHGIDQTKVPGGVEFGGGIGYEFNLDRLILSIGGEFMYLNSKTRLENYMEHRDYLYQARPQGQSTITDAVNMEFHYDFLSYEEKHQVGYLNIPIQIGMTFAEHYYAMIGAKVGINLISNYSLKATVRTTATDVTLMDELEDIHNHYLTTTDFEQDGSLSLGLNLAPTIEFGIILDEWINARFRQLNNNRRTPVSYRVGISADYSVLDLNTFSTNRGLFTEPGNNPLDIQMNGILSSSLARDKRVGNFYVGAKFTVLFQMNREKPREKRTPPPPRERQPRTPPPTFYGRIIDAQTAEEIPAELIITKQPENKQVFKGAANKRTGLINRRLTAGTYELSVTREGYLNYLETIELTQTDTIIIALEQIKKEEPIILHNLLFELNSARLDPTSEPVLDELYELLVKNPDVRIQITGHTDNTGTPAYNQRLSEERAKTVYEGLVRRGLHPDRATYDGRGEREPIESNDTEEGRAANRRVQFVIL